MIVLIYFLVQLAVAGVAEVVVVLARVVAVVVIEAVLVAEF